MSKVTEIEDRRVAKRIGSRRRFLLAGLQLIEKGRYRFTPQELADKIDMHRRSFFEIFGTLEGYFKELIEEHGASIQAQIQKDVKGGKSLSRLILVGG